MATIFLQCTWCRFSALVVSDDHWNFVEEESSVRSETSPQLSWLKFSSTSYGSPKNWMSITFKPFILDCIIRKTYIIVK